MQHIISNGSSSSGEVTMAVLGCGTMGIAILNGILASLTDTIATPSSSGVTTPADDRPPTLPSRFIACVRSPEGAQRVKTALRAYERLDVRVVQKENLAAVQQAQVILLACKPYMVNEVLREAGMIEALRGKLLISICAGITDHHIRRVLYQGRHPPKPEDGGVRIVLAMCNTAAIIRESITVIGLTDPPLPAQTKTLVTWIFKRIGDVVYLPTNTMDASTAIVGSAPAMFALVLEAAIDGAVAMGIPRPEAQKMATQAMRGATGLVQSGEHPAILREKVSTPGGCTIGGLLVLEEGGVRGSVSRAIREATCVASQLGQGLQGVNGTRPPTAPRSD